MVKFKHGKKTSTQEQNFEIIVKQNYFVLEFYGSIQIYHFRVKIAILNAKVLFRNPKQSHFQPGNRGLYSDITETTNKLASRKQTIQDISLKIYVKVKKHCILTITFSI